MQDQKSIKNEHTGDVDKATLMELMKHNHSITKNEANIWATEAVKHVALVSLAGLAGAFALKGEDAMSSAIYISALAFAAASALSVASMFCFEKVRSIDAAAHLEWFIAFLSNKPVDSASRDAEDLESKRFFRIANNLVIAAITLTVIGGSTLFAAI